MTQPDLVKMSPKGQLVVPQDIREKEDFAPGDHFISVPVRDGVLFKKVRISSPKIEFSKLAKEIESKFKARRISPKDIDEAVRWARKSS